MIEKSQFILSLFEQLDKKGINAKERSIIDRCVGEVYEEYQHGGAVPTLRVLREKFLEQGRTGSTGFGTGIRIIYQWKSGRICT